MTDGGFISGHPVEAMRDAVTMAWFVPESFQEMVSRGLELGENRLLAAMHSPLGVIGGRMLALAISATNVAVYANDAQAVYGQAHQSTKRRSSSSARPIRRSRHLRARGTAETDRFADYATNATVFARRMTYGFGALDVTGAPPVVPKGGDPAADALLVPGCGSAARRVEDHRVAVRPPGDERCRRMGPAAPIRGGDGYGAFNGNVTVAMDASKGRLNSTDP